MPSLIFPSSFSSSKAASSWLVSSFCLIPAAQTMPQYIWMAIMAWHLHWMSTFQSGSAFFCWHARPAVSPRVNHSAMSSVWKVTIILMHLVQVVWKQRSPTPITPSAVSIHPASCKGAQDLQVPAAFPRRSSFSSWLLSWWSLSLCSLAEPRHLVS